MVVGYVDPDGADRIFQALSDATRRDIVARTCRREHSVSDLARAYPMSFAAVQKHVAVLARADLVIKRRHGREQLVRGNLEAIRRTHRLLDEFEARWIDRIDRFAEVLTDDLDRRPEPTGHPDRNAIRNIESENDIDTEKRSEP